MRTREFANSEIQRGNLAPRVKLWLHRKESVSSLSGPISRDGQLHLARSPRSRLQLEGSSHSPLTEIFLQTPISKSHLRESGFFQAAAEISSRVSG
jgi:hypothetical protein